MAPAPKVPKKKKPGGGPADGANKKKKQGGIAKKGGVADKKKEKQPPTDKKGGKKRDRSTSSKKQPSKKLTKPQLDSARKQAEKEEKERLKLQALESAQHRTKLTTDENLKRTTQLVESGSIINQYEKVVYAHIQKLKKLIEWEFFIACHDVPDVSDLIAVNSFMTEWILELQEPNLENIFKYVPGILEVIEQLKQFLEIPPENIKLDTLFELGLMYQEFQEKLQNYLDIGTYNLIEDLRNLYDPEIGIFESIIQNEPANSISHAIWSNLYGAPDLNEHEFTGHGFTFRIPESIALNKGLFRLLKTNYDHYSDKSNSHYAPGIENSLKASIQNWRAKKTEHLQVLPELKSPEDTSRRRKIRKKKRDKSKKRKKGGKSKERGAGKEKKAKKKGGKKGAADGGGEATEAEDDDEWYDEEDATNEEDYEFEDEESKMARKNIEALLGKKWKKKKKGGGKKKGKKKKKKAGGESGGEESEAEGGGGKKKKKKAKKEKKVKAKVGKGTAPPTSDYYATTDGESAEEGEEEWEEDEGEEEEEEDEGGQEEIDEFGQVVKKSRRNKELGPGGADSDEGIKKSETKEERKARRRREEEQRELEEQDDFDLDFGGDDEGEKRGGKKAYSDDDDDEEGEKRGKKVKRTSIAPSTATLFDQDQKKEGEEGEGAPNAEATASTAKKKAKKGTKGGKKKKGDKSSGDDDDDEAKKGGDGGEEKKAKKKKGRKGRSKSKKNKKKKKKGSKSRSKSKKKGKKKKGGERSKTRSKTRSGSKGGGAGGGKKKGAKKDRSKTPKKRGRSESAGGTKKKKPGRSKTPKKDKSRSASAKSRKGRSRTPKKKGKKAGGAGGKKARSKSGKGKSKDRSKSAKKGKKGKGRSKSGKRGKKGGKAKGAKKSKSREKKDKTLAGKIKELERAEKTPFLVQTQPNELNLRKYVINGGIYNFKMLHIPQQPKERGEWILQLMEDERIMTEIPFLEEYADPPLPNVEEEWKNSEEGQEVMAKEEEYQKLVSLDVKLPEIILNEHAETIQANVEKLRKFEQQLKERYEEEKSHVLDKLISITIKLPDSTLWFSTPIPVRWDPDQNIWSKDGFYDVKFEPETQLLNFHSSCFGILGFGVNRWAHLPFTYWELRPAPSESNRTVLLVKTQVATLEFTIFNDLICLSLLDAPQSQKVQDALLNVYMKPGLLIKALRSHGLDIFPDFDSYAYMDGILTKKQDIEDYTYQCMSIVSPAFTFSWSKWNSGIERDKMVYQMQPKAAKGSEPLIILNTYKSTYFINCNETSPSFSDDPKIGSEYTADLIQLVTSTGSNSARELLRTTSPPHVETIRLLLTSVRPLSFSS